MKTGFDLIKPTTTLDKQQKEIIAMITLFTEHAIKNGCIYIKHSKRTQVTVEDLKRGLMLEVFLFTKRPGVVEKATEILTEIENYSESDDEEEFDIVPEDDEEEFEESNCDCAFCTCMNDIYKRWDEWTPSNDVEKILHKHISNM
jgi:hypothetical protein